jgi:hypothetical protein
VGAELRVHDEDRAIYQFRLGIAVERAGTIEQKEIVDGQPRWLSLREMRLRIHGISISSRGSARKASGGHDAQLR